jgi:uncharacterized protein (TIRG00374 family)
LSLSQIFRLTLAIGLTAYVIWSAEPRQVAAAARDAHPGWIGAAVALVIADRALMAWRWIDLLAALSPGSRPPFPTVLRVFFVSTFVGTFLPSVGGDVYRAYSLSRHAVPVAESAASVFVDRMLGVLSIVLLGVAAVAAAPGLTRDPGVVAALAIGGAVCLVAILITFSDRAASIAQYAAGHVRHPKLQRFALSLTDAVRRYAHHHGALVRVLAASIAVQALRVLQAYCLGRSLGIVLPLSAYFVFIPIILLVMLLPITVNGLGTSQLAFDWLFSQAGIASADAVALSILFVALGIIGNLPGAVLYATGERRSLG